MDQVRYGALVCLQQQASLAHFAGTRLAAIFNILVIIGLAGILSSSTKGLPLDWRPVFRDVVGNAIAFLYLLWVCNDSRIYWYLPRSSLSARLRMCGDRRY